MRRFTLWLLIFAVSGYLFYSSNSEGVVDPEEFPVIQETVVEDFNLDTWVDPMGESREVINIFPEESVRLVGRIARGIKVIKGDHFWVCGERLEGVERDRVSTLIAYNIVVVSSRFKLNPWGVAGTIANESRFDPCALGLHPRKWAISEGLLSKKKNRLSYSEKEVMSVVNNEVANEYFKRSGFDLGLCQVLTRFYDGDPSDMLQIDTGISICVSEMNDRARYRGTQTPWLYWPGAKAPWYEEKVKRWARLMGAEQGEI